MNQVPADLESIAARTPAHYYRPAGLPSEQQPWLVSVWRMPV